MSWKLVFSSLSYAWLVVQTIALAIVGAAIITGAFALAISFSWNLFVAPSFGWFYLPIIGVWGLCFVVWVVGQWFKSMVFNEKAK